MMAPIALFIVAVAVSGCSADYLEWTSAAVTARPHIKAVIPITRSTLSRWPIDELTLQVDMAGSRSEIGLHPVLVADLIHSSWCDRVANGSGIRYLPLKQYVPAAAATWNLNGDGKTVVTTKRVTNWIRGICVVIRPLGHEISQKVSASAWTKRMNVEMGVALNSALTNMMMVLMASLTAMVVVPLVAVASVRRTIPADLSPAIAEEEKPIVTEEEEEEEEEDDREYTDEEYDDDYEENSGDDEVINSDPCCEDGFVAVQRHLIETKD